MNVYYRPCWHTTLRCMYCVHRKAVYFMFFSSSSVVAMFQNTASQCALLSPPLFSSSSSSSLFSPSLLFYCCSYWCEYYTSFCFYFFFHEQSMIRQIFFVAYIHPSTTFMEVCVFYAWDSIEDLFLDIYPFRSRVGVYSIFYANDLGDIVECTLCSLVPECIRAQIHSCHPYA